MKQICVKQFLNIAEAEIAKGYLESEGIECALSSDDCGGARPHLSFGSGGIRLMVYEAKAKQAIELLENIPQ